MSTTNYIKLAIIMADDFYNQNIGPLKGSYFGPGVGGSESQRRFSDYYAKSINPVRESIKETEERKMKAEKMRQDIEAENERRKKAAREAELKLAAQKKVDGVIGEVDTILQIEDLVERQAALNKLESSLSIADRQEPTIKASLGIVQTEIDEAEGETQAQREAQDSETESRVKRLIESGKFNQARKAIRKISDPTKKNELRSLLVGKKPSEAAVIKEQFTAITKRADTALSELSKIEPSSVAQENQGDSRSSITLSRGAQEAMEAAEKRAREENLTEKEIEEAIDKAKAEYTKLDPDIAGGEKPTGSNNQQILQAARDSYAEMFGSKKADELFDQYDADKISESERRELVDKVRKDLAGIKRKSITNKRFFKQFVPYEGILPLPEKPKEPTPEGTKTDTENTEKNPKDPESGSKEKTFGGKAFVGK